MNFNWPIVKIEDIKAKSKNAITIGPFGSRMKSDCYVEFGVAVIRGLNIGAGPDFIKNFVYITEEKADELKSCNVYKNDLVFPHRGSIGEVGIVDSDQRYVLSSSLMKLTCDNNKVHPKFIYYFFKSNTGKHELLKNSSQVGTPGIGQPLTSLKSIELRLPPKEQQEKIAIILEALDDKIQLNHQINQTLEQMAQAIFKSWFVDFEPVKAKIAALEAGGSEEDALQAAMQAIAGKSADDLAHMQSASPEQYAELHATAELFPSAMQDSELGEVPEGWEVFPLSQMIELIGGGTPKKSEPSFWNGNIFWFSVQDIPSEGNVFIVSTKEKITEEGLKRSSTKILPLGTTIITARGTVGKIALTGVATAMNQSCYGVIGSKGTGPYLNFLRLQRAVVTLKRNTHGAVFDTITRSTFETVIQPCACLAIRHRFEETVKPLFDEIKNNLIQSNTLGKTRDTLLPKLLSGELSVSDAEVAVKAGDAAHV